MRCSESTEQKCCVPACGKCCKHPRGDHKKINKSGKSPLYLQRKVHSPLQQLAGPPANAREIIVILQHGPAGRQLIFKTQPRWENQQLFSCEKWAVCFLQTGWFFYFFFSFDWSYCARAFLAGGLDWCGCHIPKPGTRFDLQGCGMKIKPFLSLSAHLKSSPALPERSCVPKLSCGLCLILCNALECSCQNPWAFLVQSSPDLPEMPGFICAPGPCVVLAADSLCENLSGFLAIVSLIFLLFDFSLPSSVGFSFTPSPPQLKSPLCFCDWKKEVFFPIWRRMMKILGKHWSLIAGKRLIGRGRICSWVYQQKSAFYDCCHEQVASHLFFLQTIPSWE